MSFTYSMGLAAMSGCRYCLWARAPSQLKARARTPARAFLSHAQEKVGAQIDLRGPVREAGARDQLGLFFGKVAFGLVGMEGEEPVRHDRGQDAVAEKLHPLVKFIDASFSGVRFMSQGL